MYLPLRQALLVTLVLISYSIAAPPTTVSPVAVSAVGIAAASTDESADTAWVEIISPQGPVGVAKIGRDIVHCGDVKLKPNSKGLEAIAGQGVVASLGKQGFGEHQNLFSREKFGDCELELEFLIAKGSNSGVKLQGRYEIQLYDSHHKEQPTARECGGIYPHWIFQGPGKPLKYIDEGVPPRTNAAKPAGEWQTLRIAFKAPRFDAEGAKTANARFVSVVLNDREIHKDVEVDSPTGNASTPLPEVSRAPLMLQLDHGAVAFRNVRVSLQDSESP